VDLLHSSPAELADFVRPLLTQHGAIPGATIISTSPRVAAALRAALAVDEPLIGIRFLSPLDLALEMLARDAIPVRLQSLHARAIMLHALIASGDLDLRYFQLDQLRKGPGYAEAIATTIHELEEGGLRPEDLGAGRAADVATMWTLLESRSGTRISAPRAIMLAANRPFPFPGPRIAILATELTGAETILLDSIRDLTAILLPTKSANAATNELGVLKRFEKPKALSTIDGSVHVETTSGTADEIDRAVDWAIAQVRGPLERIAILIPTLDPMAAMIAERLERAGLDAFVAGGVPAIDLPSGKRLALVLRAIESRLDAESLAALGPLLKLEDRLSRRASVEIFGSCGTLGGTPEEFAKWPAAMPDPLRPAMASLVAAATAAESAPIGDLWMAVETFIKAHLHQLPDEFAALTRLGDVLVPYFDGWLGASLTGREALRVTQVELERLRAPHGRFGEPRVYVGTIGEAQGLAFDAVRMIGLCEGEFPSSPREDAILPDRHRPEGAPLRADRPERDRTAFGRVVQGVAKRIVFSAPAESLDRSERMISNIFVDISKALRRTDDDDKFWHFYVMPGNDAAAPRSPLVAVANGGAAPAGWIAHHRAMRAVRTDGILAPTIAANRGLDPKEPISFSRLQHLIDCAFRFLLVDLLGWGEAPALPDGQFAPLPYGSMAHKALEVFLKQHGTAFAARQETTRLLGEAATIAKAQFDEFIKTFPVPGEGVRNAQRDRLVRDVRAMLELDAARPPMKFESAEKPFGFDEEVAIDVGRKLYLHGYIDRIDRRDDGLFIRDFKTGRPHPRLGDEAKPTPSIDVQLAVYAMALQALGETVGGVAYVYGRHVERAFEGEELGTLVASVREWLRIVAALHAERNYPKTTNIDDCEHCHFRFTCGADVAALAGAEGLLAEYRDFKEGPP